jgi:hypothetical protein
MSSGPNIFDRRLLRIRQIRARRLTPATFLLDRVAADLAERLSAILRKFDVAVDLGTPTDAVRRVLLTNKNIGTVVTAGLDRGGDGLRVTADEEALPFAEGSLDLVVSALALQFVNDLPGTDPARSQTGWIIAGGVDRWGKPYRIAFGVRRRRE